MTGLNQHTMKLLAFSAEQYRELLQHAEKLSRMLDVCDYSRVHEHAGRLQALQLAASRQDELLLPLLMPELARWEEHDLYRRRQTFMTGILELNELLLSKIRGMMAVTSAELEQLRGGRTVVSGYARPAIDQRGLRGVG